MVMGLIVTVSADNPLMDLKLPVLRLIDELGACASDALQLAAKESKLLSGLPVRLSSPEDPNPLVGVARFADMKVAIACVDPDDASHTLLPATEKELLQQPELFDHLLLQNLLHAPVANPLKMFF